MTDMSILSAKLVPNSLALLRATGNPCRQPCFGDPEALALLANHAMSPSQSGRVTPFHSELVSSLGTLPSAHKTDSHSIPIALGPAQFNEFYR